MAAQGIRASPAAACSGIPTCSHRLGCSRSSCRNADQTSLGRARQGREMQWHSGAPARQTGASRARQAGLQLIIWAVSVHIASLNTQSTFTSMSRIMNRCLQQVSSMVSALQITIEVFLLKCYMYLYSDGKSSLNVRPWPSYYDMAQYNMV